MLKEKIKMIECFFCIISENLIFRIIAEHIILVTEDLPGIAGHPCWTMLIRPLIRPLSGV